MKRKRRPGVGVGIMLLRDGNVLLGRRHHDPEKADSELHGEGTWTMPGGGVEWMEPYLDAAVREVKEETNITVRKEDLRLFTVKDDMAKDAHFLTVGLLCEESDGEAHVMEPDEIVEWRWFPLDRLPRPIFPPSRKILDEYSKNAG
ncbi:NUDIX domain-containing protein [Candidatus Woesearchaeota archaeon]|nr:NUDIX domain-containing protein [Candidatus Woesearchaeota archaeon]